MDEQDDLDIQLQRASRWTIPRLQSRLAQLSSPVENSIHPTAKVIAPLLDVFQEDPQQLDPYLKEMLPPLIARYLALVQDSQFKHQVSLVWRDSGEIAKVLSQFCKVRGPKVVSRFFNNEPRYIESILDAYALVCPDDRSGKDEVKASKQGKIIVAAADGIQSTWQQAYTMLLWLGHLMLAPFDLSTISADYNQDIQPELALDFTLFIKIPSIAMRVLEIALSAVVAADKRQSAAVALLVRLVTRPDMQKLGLLDATTDWALSRLSASEKVTNMSIHEFVGLLSFLSGLIVSADITATSKYLPRLFYSVVYLFSEETTTQPSFTSSAVAKRVAIKMERNIVLLAIKAPKDIGLDSMSVLEDVIDFLLRALADRDTQVRKAASKALSIITGKVEPVMAGDIVEAVLGSLNEDVLVHKGTRNMQSVNPLRWHGLTLTLAQMLFRRSPSPNQLPSILNALFLALDFEQRSAAGSSIGGNVRDAANFGLWSLARRYTTQELQNVDLTDLDIVDSTHTPCSVLQRIACHLLSAACLDPVGNVRRGSSAALQELIGRHPDTIYDGISLVQIVDYHAVGLRKRATTDVAFESAKLHLVYRVSLGHDLLAWRGIGAIEKQAREFAAIGVGKLSTLSDIGEAEDLVEQLVDRSKRISQADVEDRHGLVLALSSIVAALEGRLATKTIALLWGLFGDGLAFKREDLASISTRPELTAAAVVTFIASLGSCTLKYGILLEPDTVTTSYTSARNSMQACMPHIADSNYSSTIDAVRSLSKLLPSKQAHAMIQYWIRELQRPRMPYRMPAMIVALGAIYSTTDHEDDDTRQYILDTLIRIAKDDKDIEAKVIAVRSLALLGNFAPDAMFCSDSQYDTILQTMEISLNDYTINRRGDVGSLLRTEAISTFANISIGHMRQPGKRSSTCYLICHRLALEKLHKVRAEAAQCLLQLDTAAIPGFQHPPEMTSMDVSTYAYFASFTQKLKSTEHLLFMAQHLPTWREDMSLAILEGFSSSAGVGPDDILETSRAALLDALNDMVEDREQTVIRSLTETLLILLRNSLSNERTLVPVLELLAYLLDAGIMQRLASALEGPGFKWRTLLSLVQKAHFKSTAMPKLLVAVDVYRSLAEVAEIRNEVVTKLASMLMHPFPKIRVAVAETLWIVTRDEGLKPMHFTEAALGRAFVEGFKAKHCS